MSSKESREYAQGRIDTLSQSLEASGLSVRALARGAGVSRETAYRAMTGQGVQAYNYFLIESFIMNYYESKEQQALLRAASRSQSRILVTRHPELLKPQPKKK